MDIDFRAVYSIIELLGDIKKTYKGFTHKEEPRNFKFPRYINKPSRKFPQRNPNRKGKTTNTVRSFWI